MPRRCTVCAHPERAAIDDALVAGGSLRGIARTFALSEDALFRHRSEHIPARLAHAQEAKEATQADSLLDRLLDLSKETAAILKEVRTGEEPDNELALKAIARAEKQIELQARLLGELKETATVNVLVLPEWQTLRTAIISALAPFPQARVAVAEALQRIGNGLSA
jgi:transposase-like protein